MSDLTRYTGPVDPGPFSFRHPPGSTDRVETITYRGTRDALEVVSRVVTSRPTEPWREPKKVRFMIPDNGRDAEATN